MEDSKTFFAQPTGEDIELSSNWCRTIHRISIRGFRNREVHATILGVIGMSGAIPTLYIRVPGLFFSTQKNRTGLGIRFQNRFTGIDFSVTSPILTTTIPRLGS